MKKNTKKNNKKNLDEYIIIQGGRAEGKYMNDEGRIYTKSELQERRPDLFN